MASHVLRIHSLALTKGGETILFSGAPQPQRSCCSSAVCSSVAASQFSSSSSLHTSMVSQIHLHTKALRQVGRGISLFVASSRLPFGATAAAISGASVVVESSSRSSTELVEKDQPSSAGEFPKTETVETVKNSVTKYLIGRSEQELGKICTSLGQQKYRGREIHQLIYKTRAKHVEDFLHIPKLLREALTKEGWQVGRSPIHHVARSLDGTIKILLRLENNRLVETVGIPVFGKPGKIDRLAACVSSQVGCALKCTFCATGKGGFARNLKPHEIIEQVLVIEELFKARVSNVVFMGMGEPLMNLPGLLPAVRALNHEILTGQRMMTISTVGVPNTIARLASHKLQSTLAISAKVYPLEALLTDCRNYFHERGRRVSIEYTLLSGVNDKPEHAVELARLLHHWQLGRHVNVIPFNPISDSLFQRPTNAQVKAFVDALHNQKVTASIRRTRGLANAACGQLHSEFEKFAMVDPQVPMIARWNTKEPSLPSYQSRMNLGFSQRFGKRR